MSYDKSIIVNGYRHVLYAADRLNEADMMARSFDFYHFMNRRRSVRDISDAPVERRVIENIIMTAGTAPSGAHKQPWTFCAVSNPGLKKKIRRAAEEEERLNYSSRMSERWKKDLAPLGTDMHKPFLERAPWLIIVFKKVYEIDEEGRKHNNYYVNESVGIACGFLIAAIHNLNLVTLTHTPSPMNFLSDILKRPSNERPYLLLPVGYPEVPAYVPDIKRKNIEEIAQFYI